MRGGDAHAVGELLVAWLPEMERFIRLSMPRALAHRDSISDVTQSLVGDLLPEVGHADFEGPDAFRAWLRRCAMNKLRSRLRRLRTARRDVNRERALHDSPEDQLHAAATGPSAAARRAEREEHLERALDQLPEEQREAVILVRLLGIGHAEAATMLGKTEAANRKALQRGLQRLSKLLPDV
jgi:RNA polymerase sigma-70 factor (ECF subfamily)